MGMPQPGVWGFQQHQPQMQPIQPFQHNQGMIPPPVIGQNFFPNSAPPIIHNQANLMPNQQIFPRFQQPPLPPPQHQNANGFSPLGINLNRPPPPPPEIPVPPHGHVVGGFNSLGEFGNQNQIERRTGDWNSRMANSFPSNIQNQNSNRVEEQHNITNQTPSNQEKDFDRMFADWEAGFDSWKRENQNNPDQVF